MEMNMFWLKNCVSETMILLEPYFASKSAKYDVTLTVILD